MKPYLEYLIQIPVGLVHENENLLLMSEPSAQFLS